MSSDIEQNIDEGFRVLSERTGKSIAELIADDMYDRPQSRIQWLSLKAKLMASIPSNSKQNSLDQSIGDLFEDARRRDEARAGKNDPARPGASDRDFN